KPQWFSFFAPRSTHRYPLSVARRFPFVAIPRSTGGPMVLERMISTDRLPVGAWNGRRPVPSNPIPLGTVSGQGHPANWASILDMTGGKTGILPCTGPWIVGSWGNRYGATFLTIGKGRV